MNQLLARHPALYRALQVAGAAYLIYLGMKIVWAKFGPRLSARAHAAAQPVSGWQAVRTGFLTGVTNPKVVAYYASLFGVVIPAGAPRWLFLAATLTVISISAVWWISASLLLAAAGARRV